MKYDSYFFLSNAWIFSHFTSCILWLVWFFQGVFFNVISGKSVVIVSLDLYIPWPRVWPGARFPGWASYFLFNVTTPYPFIWTSKCCVELKQKIHLGSLLYVCISKYNKTIYVYIHIMNCVQSESLQQHIWINYGTHAINVYNYLHVWYKTYHWTNVPLLDYNLTDCRNIINIFSWPF